MEMEKVDKITPAASQVSVSNLQTSAGSLTIFWLNHFGRRVIILISGICHPCLSCATNQTTAKEVEFVELLGKTNAL